MSRAQSKTQKMKTVRCPSCRQIVMPKDPEFPFCSERCRSIDLGRWASGEYRISSPILDPDVLAGLGDLKKSGSSE
jgi:uncharacterized protein